MVIVTTALAAVVTGQMGARSFFHLQLLGRGLDLVESRAAGLMQDIHVLQIMSRNFTSLNANAGIAEIKRILSEDHDADIVVTDDAGRLLGMVGFAEIRGVAFETGLDNLLYAKDLSRTVPETLQAEDTLTTVLHLMDTGATDRVPVVADDDEPGDESGHESGHVIGIAHRDRALKAHSDALHVAWRESSGNRRKHPR